MAEFSFFWHDYETFGVVPRRDRPAQFAGLRTDAELNEIGAPVMWFCRPAPDTLPDPESVLLTGILPQQALQQGVPEHEFAARIEAELARDGTVGVGYNSIRFDDEVTRHLFWRNLIDPYAREWQNGCGRWDLMDVVRCTWALRPEGIQWPTYTEGPMQGRPSFKLEHLTAANGLAHEAAHDALSRRARHAGAGAADQAPPAAAVGLLPEAAQEGRGAGPRSAPGRPFLHLSGLLPGGARLHGHRVAAGAAPDEQERAHRLGPGAGPARTGRPGRRDRAPPPVYAAGRLARRRVAAADQDHPHQQVADRDRQPEDAGQARRAALGAGHRRRRAPRRACRRRWAARSTACGREVFARPAEAQAARRRRRPVRRLRRQRRPPHAAAPARAERRRSWPRKRPGLPRRPAGGTAVPLPRAQLSRDAGRRRAGALAAAPRRAAARRRRRCAHAGGLLRTHRCAGRSRPTNAARRSWRPCTTTPKASHPNRPEPEPECCGGEVAASDGGSCCPAPRA